MKKSEVITAKQFRQSVAKESSVYRQVAQWLKSEHPKLIYRWDASADMKLTLGQAVRLKSLQMVDRGYPDLFLAFTYRVFCQETFYHEIRYAGAYFEIKKDGEKLYKKDGITPINEHVSEQMAMLNRLQENGYYTDFAFGFEDTKTKITNYLSGKL